MDIKGLYVNIPINHTLNIVNKLLKNNRVDECIIRELMFTLRIITNQNYFQYEGNFYKPNSAIAMGSPLSGILAEIFLQDLEQHRIKHLLEGGTITYYNRYVDDIFIIYNQTKITPQTLTEHFNAQHKDLQFTRNEEINNQITYLDLNLTNRQGQLEMEVYRKPTATDVTINNKSCHPKQQIIGIQKLDTQTCQSCYKVYIGQTGRNLNRRYKEHLRNIKNNKDESAFAQHILNTGHQ
jgi:hypothetical protein